MPRQLGSRAPEAAVVALIWRPYHPVNKSGPNVAGAAPIGAYPRIRKDRTTRRTTGSTALDGEDVKESIGDLSQPSVAEPTGSAAESLE